MSPVVIYKLHSETDSLLKSLSRRVTATTKAKELETILEVTRFFVWSGIIRIIKVNADAAVLPIDAAKLERRVNELQERIREKFKFNKRVS